MSVSENRKARRQGRPPTIPDAVKEAIRTDLKDPDLTYKDISQRNGGVSVGTISSIYQEIKDLPEQPSA